MEFHSLKIMSKVQHSLTLFRILALSLEFDFQISMHRIYVNFADVQTFHMPYFQTKSGFYQCTDTLHTQWNIHYTCVYNLLVDDVDFSHNKILFIYVSEFTYKLRISMVQSRQVEIVWHLFVLFDVFSRILARFQAYIKCKIDAKEKRRKVPFSIVQYPLCTW